MRYAGWGWSPRVPHELRLWEEANPKPTANGTGRHANGWAQQQRNGHVAELVQNGHSQTAVALQLGISKAPVCRIVAAGIVGSVSAAA
jgi:hypothetical protein